MGPKESPERLAERSGHFLFGSLNEGQRNMLKAFLGASPQTISGLIKSGEVSVTPGGASRCKSELVSCGLLISSHSELSASQALASEFRRLIDQVQEPEIQARFTAANNDYAQWVLGADFSGREDPLEIPPGIKPLIEELINEEEVIKSIISASGVADPKLIGNLSPLALEILENVVLASELNRTSDFQPFNSKASRSDMSKARLVLTNNNLITLKGQTKRRTEQLANEELREPLQRFFLIINAIEYLISVAPEPESKKEA